MNQQFDGIYKNKKVLVTGNTGFKGSWLTMWLLSMEAKVYGYSLSPITNPSLFELLKLKDLVTWEEGNVGDVQKLRKTIRTVKPDIIFHLAAQPLVKESYEKPAETVLTNTIGTMNVLEAVRLEGVSPAIVFITTDKTYENKEWLFGYRETDAMGGYDPYSASKAAAELLIASWRNSFFNPSHIDTHGVRVASVRAGNVIGGGDWSKDRIVPDCIRDLQNDGRIQVRNPYATRPWQHVLEPLSGYLQLGAKLIDPATPDVASYCDAFNFGPLISSNQNVGSLVEKIIEVWGSGSWKNFSTEKSSHEASLLHLTIDKAYHKLQWLPKWSFDETVTNTVEWYKNASENPLTVFDYTMNQIHSYQSKVIKDFSTTFSSVE